MTHIARMNTPPIGTLIRDRMHAADLTQQELADLMGMSRLSINQLVNSKRRITPTTATRLSTHLGGTAVWWMDRQRDADLALVGKA